MEERSAIVINGARKISVYNQFILGEEGFLFFVLTLNNYFMICLTNVKKINCLRTYFNTNYTETNIYL